MLKKISGLAVIAVLLLTVSKRHISFLHSGGFAQGKRPLRADRGTLASVLSAALRCAGDGGLKNEEDRFINRSQIVFFIDTVFFPVFFVGVGLGTGA